jgi:sugar lactone lactonase YvrE
MLTTPIRSFVQAFKTMKRPVFYFALLTWMLPLQMLAQFCPNGVTVAGGNGQLPNPQYIVVDGDGNLYVSDRNLHNIKKFPPNSTEGIIFAGGTGAGSQLNQLNSPRGLALDQQGNLLVSDNVNHRVLLFPPNSTSLTSGTVVAGGNGSGDGPTELDSPTDITVDKDGYLYVFSAGERVLKFPPNSTSATSGTIVAGGNGFDSGLNQLNSSNGIAVDQDGNLYVADMNNRVLKFPPNSTSATFGTIVAGGNDSGSDPNQLSAPNDITVDGSGNLYVSDITNDRVQLFLPGSSSLTAGITLAGSDQLGRPHGLALDADGSLYVIDGNNKRVLRFSPGSPISFTGQQPASQTVCTGATVTATVSVSGITNGYQWYKDNVSLGEAQQQATLSLSSVDTDDGGSYYVVLTSVCNSLTSTAFTLTVNNPPTVSISPSATAVCAGTPVVLTASGATTYQWQGPGGFTSTASSVTVSTSGAYSVTGTTGACSATATASVTMYDAPPTPVISMSPSVTQPILQNAPFVTLIVTGCEAGTINWQGPNGASGSGTTISVPTSATGNLAYSATCTVGSCTSSPGSTTVTNSPSLVSGSFDGFVNGADCSTFRGWAWDRGKPNTAISVDILDGAKVIITLLADVFRQDLLDAGKGNGKHSFRFTIPESIKDGLPHNLSARVSGSSFILKDSPKALICTSTTPEGNNPPKPPTPTVLNAPLTAQVGVPFSGTLVPFTDPEGTALTYALSGLPDGLTVGMPGRIITGTPTKDGPFTVIYQATDADGASNSISFVLTVNPASTTTVTGSFEGYLDKVECGTIRGWVWDRNKPNTPVTVEFYTGSTVWGSVVANILRQDLKDARKGNGAHGYSFTVPAALKDNTTRLIYGRVQGSTFVLKDSGKPLICPSPVRLSAEPPVDLQVTVLGNPVFHQVEVEVRGVEGQSLRMQITDVEGRLVSEHQIGEAKAVERQTLSVHQQRAGLLVLRVTSGSKSVTLKVLKQ